MSSPLRIQLLGAFQLTSGETPITTLDMPRLQSLLAYLVLNRNASQSRAHLAFQLWPDSNESQAFTNLRTLLHRLRLALPSGDMFLRTDRHGLQWRPDGAWTLDVLEFEDTLTRAEQAERVQDIHVMRQALEEAIELYHGDLLPGCYDEWILPERDRLRELFLKALQRLIILLESERDYHAAINAAHHLLRHDPLHEATYRHLMRLYAVSGDRAAALRIYHTCTTLLERELATEPSRATREAYERLIQAREPTAPLTGPLLTPAPAMVTEAPLVGRKQEWVSLQEAWRTTLAGKPQLLLLAGDAGIGKTRLAEELLAWVSHQGIPTASAHCYATEGCLAYAPIATWLRANALKTTLARLTETWRTELARLLPELLEMHPQLPRPGPLTEGWQRQNLFEALTQTLLATRQPLLLLLDDIHWCDQETLAWLHYVLRANPPARIMLIGTLRPEEISHEHPLEKLLSSLRRDGQLTEITLEALDTVETIHLAEGVTGQKLDADTAALLYRETEGNPLFVVETMRAGTLENRAETEHMLHITLPSTVQAVIATRLAQLSPLAHEVVNTAAVIGRAFTFSVLARTSSADEDALVQGLDELWQRRIIREQGGDDYDFSHDKLREGAYKALSNARRRLLHRRVAEALIEIHAHALDTVSGQIAAHYEQAGLMEPAIAYYQRAGEAARQVYANTEALGAFQHALALLATRTDTTQKELQGQLYERCGDILTLTGQYDEARQAYQNAVTRLAEQAYIRREQLYRKIGDTWQSPALPEGVTCL